MRLTLKTPRTGRYDYYYMDAEMVVKTGIGQDSHRFAGENIIAEDRSGSTGGCADAAKRSAGTAGRPLLLGGVEFPGEPPLDGNSDSDVVLHALCNAISGVTGANVMGETADRLCNEEGVTDSAVYVREALKSLGAGEIVHASFSIECARPIISPKIPDMRKNIAKILGMDADGVCVTATSGERLTDFGRGLGIQTLCVVTAYCPKRSGVRNA